MQRFIDRKLNPKPPAPSRGMQKLPQAGQLRKVVTPQKVDLAKALGQRLEAPKPVRDARGQEHEAATLIKSLHRSGGQPLTKARR